MAGTAGAHGSGDLFAELARESRTAHFWLVAFRNSIPAIGVLALRWPALQAALLFVLESWVFLSLRCGIEITIDPKFNAGKRWDGYTIVWHVLVAAVFMAIVLGMFGWGVLANAFAAADWAAFREDGWHQPSFLVAIAAMIVLSIADAVSFLQRFERRTAEQEAADDGRIRIMFYRVIALLAVSGLLGWATQLGFGGEALVVAIAVLSTYLEGLPDHASRSVGMSTHTRARTGRQ